MPSLLACARELRDPHDHSNILSQSADLTICYSGQARDSRAQGPQEDDHHRRRDHRCMFCFQSSLSLYLLTLLAVNTGSTSRRLSLHFLAVPGIGPSAYPGFARHRIPLLRPSCPSIQNVVPRMMLMRYAIRAFKDALSSSEQPSSYSHYEKSGSRYKVRSCRPQFINTAASCSPPPEPRASPCTAARCTPMTGDASQPTSCRSGSVACCSPDTSSACPANAE